MNKSKLVYGSMAFVMGFLTVGSFAGYYGDSKECESRRNDIISKTQKEELTIEDLREGVVLERDGCGWVAGTNTDLYFGHIISDLQTPGFIFYDRDTYEGTRDVVFSDLKNGKIPDLNDIPMINAYVNTEKRANKIDRLEFDRKKNETYYRQVIKQIEDARTANSTDRQQREPSTSG